MQSLFAGGSDRAGPFLGRIKAAFVYDQGFLTANTVPPP